MKLPATTLKLDPTLPPKSWEVRGGGRKPKRSRREIDAETFVAALEDPKVESIAVGEAAHQDLVRVMARPGTKTATQQRLEEAARLTRERQLRQPKFFDQAGRANTVTEADLRSRLTSNFWTGGSDPKPPGTSGPGGVAS